MASVTGDTYLVHASLSAIVAIGSLIGLLIVIAGVLGAAFRTSRNVTTISNYREAAQSWETRAGAQETELADQARTIEHQQQQLDALTAKLVEKDTQIAALQAQVSSLRDLIAGRATFEALDTKIAEVLATTGENRRDLREILQIVRDEDGPRP